MDGLRVVAGVLESVLRDEQTSTLFGEPVDPVALGLDDYFDVVKQPADLGTILANVRASLAGTGPYSHPRQVADAVALVWSNCNLYNDRPVDKPIRDAAARSKSLLDRAWAAAGLGREPATPAPSASKGPAPTPAPENPGLEAPTATTLPLLRVDNFRIVSASDGEAYRLEQLPAAPGSDARLEGEVAGEPGSRFSCHVADWVLDHIAEAGPSLASEDGVWVLSPEAWVALGEPHPSYADVWSGTQTLVRLTLAARAELGAGTRLEDITAAVESAAAVLQAGSGLRGKRKTHVSHEARAFAAAQLRAGVRAAARAAARARGGATGRKRRPSEGDRAGRRSVLGGRFRLGEGPSVEDELAGISDDDMPADFEASDEDDEAASSGPGGPSAARRRAWQLVKLRRRQEAARVAAAEAEAAQVERERERDAARGSPPPPTSDFRLAPHLVPRLLAVWEFVQTFGDVLGVPPFSLPALEAALDPGPHLPHHTVKAAPASERAEVPAAATDALQAVKREEEPQVGLATPGGAPEPNGVAGGADEEKADVEMAEAVGAGQENDGADDAMGEAEAPGGTAAPAAEETLGTEAPADDEAHFEPAQPASEAAADAPGSGTEEDQSAPQGKASEGPMVKAKRQGCRKFPKVAPQNVISNPTIRTRRQLLGPAATQSGGGSPRAPEEGLKIKLKVPGLAEGSAPHDESAPQPPMEPVATPVATMGAPVTAPRQPQAAPFPGQFATPGAAQAAIAAHADLLQRRYGLGLEAFARLAPVDWSSAPAALLSRDVTCALLRVVDGAALATRGSAPRAARVAHEAVDHALTWPERAAAAVLAWPEADAAQRGAAARLAYADWLDLAPEARLAVLTALVDMALASPGLQAEIAERLDALTVASGRQDGAAGDEEEEEAAAVVGEGAGEEGAGEEGAANGRASADRGVAPSPSGRATADDWLEWQVRRRLGLRRALGVDTRGRRYWALGGAAGAFRVFCERVPESAAGCAGDGVARQDGAPTTPATDASSPAATTSAASSGWGWYEGAGVAALRAWLAAGGMRREAGLLATLADAPWPTDQLRPGRPASAVELSSLRADGYRGLVAPLLRGDWQCARGGVYASAEARLAGALDALLGAVPLWFRGEVLQRQHLAIGEALAGGVGPREAGIAVAETERLLALEGVLGGEWRDVWQVVWRRGLSLISDVREAAMYAAALQRHAFSPDVVPRPVFERLMAEANCHLVLPFPGDSVVILRSGALMHIDRYMEVLGIAEDSEEPKHAGGTERLGDGPVAGEVNLAAAAPAGAGQAPSDAVASAVEATASMSIDATPMETSALPADASQPGPPPSALASAPRRQDDGATPGPATTPPGPATVLPGIDDAMDTDNPGPSPVPYPVRDASVARVKGDWAALRARVATAGHVGRYTVRSIVYRRHLVDEADAAEGSAVRRPGAWLFLRPARFGPPAQLPRQDLVLPLAADPGLPDFLVPTEAFVEHMRVSWLPGDRFRLHPTSIKARAQRRAKSGILTQRGTVVDLVSAAPGPGADPVQRAAYDPFRSVVVLWDRAFEGEEVALSPWDLEVDPEDERRRVEEARRQQQAAARALRARGARRAGEDAEQDAEEARLRALLHQGSRAEELLRAYESKPVPGPEDTTFNEEVHGWQRAAAASPLQTLMVPLLFPTYGYTATGQASPGGSAPLAAAGFAALQAAAAAAVHVAPPGGFHMPGLGALPGGDGGDRGAGFASLGHPSGPLRPGQEIAAEVLSALKPLSPDEFTTLLTNFYRGLKGKYKVPTFAHRDLDLHTVFWAVSARGGYETVTAGKQWKEICRCLDVDLTGQTSASYNMRLNYERCLLDFENYLASGKYEEDLAAGAAPVHTHLTDPSVHRFTIPGAYVGEEPGEAGEGAAAAAVAGPAPQARPQRVQPPRAAAAGVAPLAAMFAGSPPDGPGAGAAPSAAARAAPSLRPRPERERERVGQTLATLGEAAVGRRVDRYWPEEGGWWAAEITGYRAETGEHALTYARGTADESFEWADLSEFHDTELRLGEEDEGNGEDGGPA